MYYLLSVFLFCKVQDWVVEPPQIEGTPVAKVENDEEDGEDNQESDVGFSVVVSPTGVAVVVSVSMKTSGVGPKRGNTL